MKVATPPADELIAELPDSVLFLGPWQSYLGYCVLVAKTHATELPQLTAAARHAFLEEMNRVAAALLTVFRPRKLNYELLGNQVPHLHWHLFPRYDSDSEHLLPVWVALQRAETDPEEKKRLQTGSEPRERTMERIRQALGVARA